MSALAWLTKPIMAHDPLDRLRRAFASDEVSRRIWWFWWWPPLWFAAVILGEFDYDLYPEDRAAAA